MTEGDELSASSSPKKEQKFDRYPSEPARCSRCGSPPANYGDRHYARLCATCYSKLNYLVDR